MEEIMEAAEAASTDLTPIMDQLDEIAAILTQQTEVSRYIFLGLFAVAGIVVGCAVGWLLHDLWR